jgi:hypothetical protein
MCCGEAAVTTWESRVFYKFSSDVCGPIGVISQRGSKYFVTFICATSNCVFVRFMARKNQVLEKFRRVRLLVENPNIPQRVKVLKSDNGGEHNSKDWSPYCLEGGIYYHFTVTDKPNRMELLSG